MRFFFFPLLFFFFQSEIIAQEAELVIQSGHTAWINDYNVSSDNKYMVTGSVDNTIKLWDLRSKKEIRTFRGHKSPVNQVVFSHNSKTIASGDDKGFVYLWDIRTGKLLDTFRHFSKILSIAFSTDDSRLATNGRFRLFKIRDIKSRALLTDWRMWSQGGKLQFVPRDNNLVSFVSADSTFNIWDIKGDSMLKSSFYAKAAVTDFTISKNGRFVISIVNADSSIRVFDMNEWKIFKRIYSHNFFQDKVVNGDDDSSIFTSSNYSVGNRSYMELKKWNFYSGICTDSITSSTESHYNPRLVYAAINKELIFLYRASRLGMVGTDPFQPAKMFKTSGTLVNIVMEREPGNFILIAEDGPVKELNITTNAYRIVLPTTDSGIISQLVPLADSIHGLARIRAKPELFRVNLRSFERKAIIRDSNTIRNFKLSANGSRVAYYTTQTSNGQFLNKSAIIVKDLAKDSILYKKPFPSFLLYSYGILNNGEALLYQDKYDTLSLYDFASGKTRYLFDSSYKFEVLDYSTTIDGGRLLTTTNKGKIFLWDFNSGRLIKSIAAHDGFFCSLIFSGDSQQFISISDEIVKLWDTKTLTLKQSYKGHQSWVSHAGFLAGENELYTCSADQTFRIWNVRTGMEKASFMMVDSADLVTRLPNNFYASSKQGTKHLSYRINNELYPFEQFDLQYNRPHEVLRALGASDLTLVDAYQRAYQRRLKKAGFKEADFNKDIHLPQTIILNSDKIPSLSKTMIIDIPFKLTDSKYNIDRYFVSVNNVPVNRTNGTSLKAKARKSYQVSLPITLSVGINKIQISCMNEKGVESLRKDVYVTYRPSEKVESQIYFIGIGVSRYKDSLHNLTYADKDTRDLATLFKNKYPGVAIDTLLNEQATASAIKKLKEKLYKTSPEDVVIISVSSHGMLDKDLNYYIGTHDVAFDNPADKGLKYEDLENLLEDIPARKKLLLIDACHSGEVDKEEGITEIIDSGSLLKDTGITRGGIVENESTSGKYKTSLEIMNELFADVSRGSGAVIIGAAGGREYAFEDAQWNNGVFTYTVIRGLLEKLADSNGDGISVSELHNYVSEQVYKLTGGRQQPTTRKENIEFDWKIWN